MAAETVICPDCKGRGKVERAVRDDLSTMSVKIGSAVSVTDSFQLVTEQCGRCYGKGRVAETERVPVMQDGVRVGTLPPGFDPDRIKSTSWLYDPRHGDFVRSDGAWIASRTLGHGDLESVPGFVWDR